MSNPPNKYLVIYHTNCADGRFAAAAAQLGLESRGQDNVELYAAQYNENPPNVAGYAHVYIVDFSYPRAVMLSMCAINPNITVLDHHKTAQADLTTGDALPCEVVFDMEESGATLAWKYFFPEHPMPEVLGYIKDRDLWQFKLPSSKEVTAALGLCAKSVESARETLRNDVPADSFVSVGTVLLEQWNKIVESLAESASSVTLYHGEAALPAKIINAPHMFASDISQYLFDEDASVEVVAVWNLGYDADATVVSLRGAGRVDVSTLAKVYGGGGHHNAAGCKLANTLTMPVAMMSKILHWGGIRT